MLWVCLRIFVVGCVNFVCVAASDVPKPLGDSETSPGLRTPTQLAHQTRRDSGEQIPQVSVIMLLISGNVHGASLKPSELI